jgi:hypothetical protein
MKLRLAAVLLVCIGGCKVASTDTVASPGRWQVIQTEYSLRSEKQPMLVDTYTGETWVQGWDSSHGYIWKPAEKRR